MSLGVYCKWWDASERTAGWYKGKNFCRHWSLSPKWRIMQEKTQEQVNLSRWNGSNISHRKLEVL